MINIIILLIVFCVYKSLALAGFGYFTFRPSNRPYCYFDSSKSDKEDDQPYAASKRKNDDDTNVTQHFMYVL